MFNQSFYSLLTLGLILLALCVMAWMQQEPFYPYYAPWRWRWHYPILRPYWAPLAPHYPSPSFWRRRF